MCSIARVYLLINVFRLRFIFLLLGSSVSQHLLSALLIPNHFADTGEHISGKIREHYLAACMRQNIGFFDKLGAGEITTRITADTNLVQDGISEKIGLTLAAVATFITAFIIGKLNPSLEPKRVTHISQ